MNKILFDFYKFLRTKFQTIHRTCTTDEIGTKTCRAFSALTFDFCRLPFAFRPLLFALCFLPFALQAKHIVGGEITYKYVSTTNNVVKLAFTLKIYRDCLGNGPQLDTRALIGIFVTGGSQYGPTILVPVEQPITEVAKPSYPCLIPPDVCVQQGVYEWQSDFPINEDGYTVEYQRCCRNETITNISTPGEVGATYSVQITALSLKLANSSPVFKSFPPIIICLDKDINFDHSASDAEGDQIIYRFCQPQGGGGKAMSNFASCYTAVPNPPCYPPQGPAVRFKEPTYSFDNPIGGSPRIKIDPNTGLITGTPDVQGQYVVGVCAEEYRNGKLLSIIQRDFQFNVAQCKGVIEAKVVADTVIKKDYIISVCGVDSLKIVNLSFDRKNVVSSYFDIQFGTDTKRFSDWEPTISFPDTGVFQGKFIINPGSTCNDSIDLTFNVFKAAHPNFSVKYDTCVSGPISFTDHSISLNGAITKYKWSFGDSTFSFTKNPSHLYDLPGAKSPTLTITDIKKCSKDTTVNFNWQPIPALIVVNPSASAGCTPLSVLYSNLSKPIDSTYTVKWTFSDSTKYSDISPTKIYTTPGTYSAFLQITSPIGCYTSKNFPNIAKVRQGTHADFDYTPTHVSTYNNVVNFIDKSKNASIWHWYFNEKAFSPLENPIYTFRDSGVQTVRLVTANAFNCSDTIIKYLDVVPFVSYYLPNAFTPNNDNKNDIFRGAGITEGIQGFKMTIWNRWGERIYVTDDPAVGWNGKKYNTGEDEPQGVYMCVVNYLTPRGEYKEIRSYATLIR